VPLPQLRPLLLPLVPPRWSRPGGGGGGGGEAVRAALRRRGSREGRLLGWRRRVRVPHAHGSLLPAGADLRRRARCTARSCCVQCVLPRQLDQTGADPFVTRSWPLIFHQMASAVLGRPVVCFLCILRASFFSRMLLNMLHRLYTRAPPPPPRRHRPMELRHQRALPRRQGGRRAPPVRRNARVERVHLELHGLIRTKMLADAPTVFDAMPSRNSKDGCSSDHATFRSVLSACAHKGYLYEGCNYFTSMQRDWNLIP
jgi:hypothetical protein